MKIGKQLKVLSLAVFAAIAFAAVDFGRRRSAKPVPDYTRFAECPAALPECVHNTIRGGKEKMTYSLEAIQSSFAEFNAALADGLFEQIILGKTCYVGNENPALDTEELLVTAIDGGSPRPNSSEVRVENNDQTKSFYELNQRKDHLG